MQVVEIEIDERLLTAVDDAAANLQTNRSDFIKNAVLKALREVWRNQSDEEKVQRFIKSYERHPQQPEEYEIWQEEQVWGDE